MRRQLILALGLFVVGTTAYFLQSGAPPRVHFVTVPLQFLFLVGGVAIGWMQPLPTTRRIVALLLFTGLMGLVWTYSLSTVVLKLEPFNPAFLVPATLALGGELLAFLALVWAFDWSIKRLRRFKDMPN